MMTWWIRRYPPDIFPGIVTQMEKLIADGKLVTSEYVVQELGARPDPLFIWADSQGDFLSQRALPTSSAPPS